MPGLQIPPEERVCMITVVYICPPIVKKNRILKQQSLNKKINSDGCFSGSVKM